MATPRFDPADAAWLAHRLVESTDAVRFAHVPRAAHAAMAVLTDDGFSAQFGAMPPQVDVPDAQLLATFGKRPLGLLFQSAFCGSTLLTRALAEPGAAMGLSEPVILNDVVGMRSRGAPPAAAADTSISMLKLTKGSTNDLYELPLSVGRAPDSSSAVNTCNSCSARSFSNRALDSSRGRLDSDMV